MEQETGNENWRYGNYEFNKTMAFEAQGDYASGGAENVISNTGTKKNKLSQNQSVCNVAPITAPSPDA